MSCFCFRPGMSTTHADLPLVVLPRYVCTQPEVFESFGIEDHVRGRHSLLLLHIWIVGYGIRSRPGPDSSKFLAAYFHHWWTHTDGELEEFGIKRIATRQKYLTEIQGGSHGSLLAFDKTFPLALEGEWESLYGAIFRCIHQYSAQSNHPINKEYLKAVGAYMLENVKAITQMTDEEFVFRIFQGHLSWNIPVASNREQVAKGRLINAQELALYCVSISPKPKATK